MMNRQAFKQSFLAEIMTRAITLTPGENDLEDVKVLHGVMKDLDVGMNLPAGALVIYVLFIQGCGIASEMPPPPQKIFRNE
jgi:hypothetical protein